MFPPGAKTARPVDLDDLTFTLVALLRADGSCATRRDNLRNARE
jgi:hypothetical protein